MLRSARPPTAAAGPAQPASSPANSAADSVCNIFMTVSPEMVATGDETDGNRQRVSCGSRKIRAFLRILRIPGLHEQFQLRLQQMPGLLLQLSPDRGLAHRHR